VTYCFNAIFCDHTQMVECHEGCGHFACPCGIAWDECAEGYFYEPYDYEDPSVWNYEPGARRSA